jgi:TRAP-type C4-dicarboxylate transport system substrate-binding protein
MRLFRSIAVAALATFAALSPQAARAQTIELKLSHFIPPNHTFHKWALAWADQLAKESNGRLKITIYPNGQLVGPPNRQFDAARNGIVDMAFVLHGVTPGRYPMTELVNLAFSWPKAGSGSSVTSKRLTELAPQYLAKEHEACTSSGWRRRCRSSCNPSRRSPSSTTSRASASAMPAPRTARCTKRWAPRRC